VWDDVVKNKYHFKKYQLHTKIVIVTTVLLIVSGSTGFYVFERANLLADMSLGEKILHRCLPRHTANGGF
jgi:trk system potassium uptake protein TrkH